MQVAAQAVTERPSQSEQMLQKTLQLIVTLAARPGPQVLS